MKKTLKTIAMAVGFAWHSVISYLSPAWLGLTYMCITGHGKGYAYDLGSERDISIIFGIVLLIGWLAVFLPTFALLTRTLYRQKKRLALIPVALFVLAFLIGVLVMGVGRFAAFFGV